MRPTANDGHHALQRASELESRIEGFITNPTEATLWGMVKYYAQNEKAFKAACGRMFAKAALKAALKETHHKAFVRLTYLVPVDSNPVVIFLGRLILPQEYFKEGEEYLEKIKTKISEFISLDEATSAEALRDLIGWYQHPKTRLMVYEAFLGNADLFTDEHLKRVKQEIDTNKIEQKEKSEEKRSQEQRGDSVETSTVTRRVKELFQQDFLYCVNRYKNCCLLKQALRNFISDGEENKLQIFLETHQNKITNLMFLREIRALLSECYKKVINKFLSEKKPFYRFWLRLDGFIQHFIKEINSQRNHLTEEHVSAIENIFASNHADENESKQDDNREKISPRLKEKIEYWHAYALLKKTMYAYFKGKTPDDLKATLEIPTIKKWLKDSNFIELMDWFFGKLTGDFFEERLSIVDSIFASDNTDKNESKQDDSHEQISQRLKETIEYWHAYALLRKAIDACFKEKGVNTANLKSTLKMPIIKKWLKDSNFIELMNLFFEELIDDFFFYPEKIKLKELWDFECEEHTKYLVKKYRSYISTKHISALDKLSNDVASPKAAIGIFRQQLCEARNLYRLECALLYYLKNDQTVELEKLFKDERDLMSSIDQDDVVRFIEKHQAYVTTKHYTYLQEKGIITSIDELSCLDAAQKQIGSSEQMASDAAPPALLNQFVNLPECLLLGQMKILASDPEIFNRLKAIAGLLCQQHLAATDKAIKAFAKRREFATVSQLKKFKKACRRLMRRYNFKYYRQFYCFIPTGQAEADPTWEAEELANRVNKHLSLPSSKENIFHTRAGAKDYARERSKQNGLIVKINLSSAFYLRQAEDIAFRLKVSKSNDRLKSIHVANAEFFHFSKQTNDHLFGLDDLSPTAGLEKFVFFSNKELATYKDNMLSKGGLSKTLIKLTNYIPSRSLWGNASKRKAIDQLKELLNYDHFEFVSVLSLACLELTSVERKLLLNTLVKQGELSADNRDLVYRLRQRSGFWETTTLSLLKEIYPTVVGSESDREKFKTQAEKYLKSCYAIFETHVHDLLEFENSNIQFLADYSKAKITALCAKVFAQYGNVLNAGHRESLVAKMVSTHKPNIKSKLKLVLKAFDRQVANNNQQYCDQRFVFVALDRGRMPSEVQSLQARQSLVSSIPQNSKVYLTIQEAKFAAKGRVGYMLEIFLPKNIQTLSDNDTVNFSENLKKNIHVARFDCFSGSCSDSNLVDDSPSEEEKKAAPSSEPEHAESAMQEQIPKKASAVLDKSADGDSKSKEQSSEIKSDGTNNKRSESMSSFLDNDEVMLLNKLVENLQPTKQEEIRENSSAKEEKKSDALDEDEAKQKPLITHSPRKDIFGGKTNKASAIKRFNSLSQCIDSQLLATLVLVLGCKLSVAQKCWAFSQICRERNVDLAKGEEIQYSKLIEELSRQRGLFRPTTTKQFADIVAQSDSNNRRSDLVKKIQSQFNTVLVK